MKKPNDQTTVDAKSSGGAPKKGASSSSTVKKSTPSSNKKLRKELDQFRAENIELKDRLLRKLAEFDNLRKRTNREFADVVSRANEGIVRNLLPVLDDLERSLNHQPDDQNIDSFTEGIELIYNKLYKTLEESGLKPIESEGKAFDPGIHEAMMNIENPDVPSGNVIEAFEKGYYLNNKVIRHSKVSVSK